MWMRVMFTWMYKYKNTHMQVYRYICIRVLLKRALAFFEKSALQECFVQFKVDTSAKKADRWVSSIVSAFNLGIEGLPQCKKP